MRADHRPEAREEVRHDGRGDRDLLVIVGGESGPGHRPMDPDWARAIRDQCAAAGVAFHFKQHGGATHAAGGRLLDGREHLAIPTPRETAAAR